MDAPEARIGDVVIGEEGQQLAFEHIAADWPIGAGIRERLREEQLLHEEGRGLTA